MNKLSKLSLAVLAAGCISVAALAAPQPKPQEGPAAPNPAAQFEGGRHHGAPQGFMPRGPRGFGENFDEMEVSSVDDALKNAKNDELVRLKGSLTAALGDHRYELTDASGSGKLVVKLDKKRNWSYLAKDMQIEVFAKVDEEKSGKIFKVLRAIPDMQQLGPQERQGREAPRFAGNRERAGEGNFPCGRQDFGERGYAEGRGMGPGRGMGYGRGMGPDRGMGPGYGMGPGRGMGHGHGMGPAWRDDAPRGYGPRGYEMPDFDDDDDNDEDDD